MFFLKSILCLMAHPEVVAPDGAKGSWSNSHLDAFSNLGEL